MSSYFTDQQKYLDAHTCFFYTDIDLDIFNYRTNGRDGRANDEKRNYLTYDSLKNINISGVTNIEGRINNYIRVDNAKIFKLNSTLSYFKNILKNIFT